MKVYRCTPKEQSEMRRMGYTVRAWYRNERGIPFHKNFITIEDFWEFSDKVREAKGEILGHHIIAPC